MKIIATYAVKVTVRSDQDDVEPPTNAEIEDAIVDAVSEELSDVPDLSVSASSERTDK